MAASGLAFVVLAIAAALVGGSPPNATDTAANVADYTATTAPDS